MQRGRDALQKDETFPLWMLKTIVGPNGTMDPAVFGEETSLPPLIPSMTSALDFALTDASSDIRISMASVNSIRIPTLHVLLVVVFGVYTTYYIEFAKIFTKFSRYLSRSTASVLRRSIKPFLQSVSCKKSLHHPYNPQDSFLLGLGFVSEKMTASRDSTHYET